MIQTAEYMDHTPPNWLEPGQEVHWEVLLEGGWNTLLTDGNGSYGLVCHVQPVMCEFHFYVDPAHRNRSGEIAREMIEWIEHNLDFDAIMVKTKFRHVRLLALKTGFASIDSHEINGEEYAYLMRFRPIV